MFGTAVSSGRPGVPSSLEQGDFVAKPPPDLSAGLYSHALSGSCLDCVDSPRPDEAKVSHTFSSAIVVHPTKFPVTTCFVLFPSRGWRTRGSTGIRCGGRFWISRRRSAVKRTSLETPSATESGRCCRIRPQRRTESYSSEAREERFGNLNQVLLFLL